METREDKLEYEYAMDRAARARHERAERERLLDEEDSAPSGAMTEGKIRRMYPGIEFFNLDSPRVGAAYLHGDFSSAELRAIASAIDARTIPFPSCVFR